MASSLAHRNDNNSSTNDTASADAAEGSPDKASTSGDAGGAGAGGAGTEGGVKGGGEGARGGGGGVKGGAGGKGNAAATVADNEYSIENQNGVDWFWCKKCNRWFKNAQCLQVNIDAHTHKHTKHQTHAQRFRR